MIYVGKPFNPRGGRPRETGCSGRTGVLAADARSAGSGHCCFWLDAGCHPLPN